jgi:uncharacterized protein (TIGR02145 family)
MIPLLGIGQTNSKVEMPNVGNANSEKQPLEIKRNSFYNLEEIKVRWRKASLENCLGVPCVSVTAPGSPTNVTVVAGNAQATVSFTIPSSTGGSAITSYTVTSTPGGFTGIGLNSPIIVTGLANGTSYTFSVVATNAVGNSLASAASNAVTPVAACSAGTASSTPTLTVNTALTNITHNTTSANGIGTALGLPAGVTAAWSANVITISGMPTASGIFNYIIPLTGTSCSSVNATGTITVTLPPSFTCGTSTITDLDGNTYNTVLIDLQCWTKENLKVTKYSDSSPIDFDNSGGTPGNIGSGLTWSTRISGAYTIYGNELSTGPNATKYGFLYNWYAASDARKICPTGWHVPTDVEWMALESYLGGNTVAGGKMKSTGDITAGTGLWDTPNLGANNLSGFTGHPGGYRWTDNTFQGEIYDGYFWSTTASSISNAWSLYLDHSSDSSDIGSGTPKSVGYSIRCLKD